MPTLPALMFSEKSDRGTRKMFTIRREGWPVLDAMSITAGHQIEAGPMPNSADSQKNLLNGAAIILKNSTHGDPARFRQYSWRMKKAFFLVPSLEGSPLRLNPS